MKSLAKLVICVLLLSVIECSLIKISRSKNKNISQIKASTKDTKKQCVYDSDGFVYVKDCSPKYVYIKSQAAGLCLGVNFLKTAQEMTLQACDTMNEHQHWELSFNADNTVYFKSRQDPEKVLVSDAAYREEYHMYNKKTETLPAWTVKMVKPMSHNIIVDKNKCLDGVKKNYYIPQSRDCDPNNKLQQWTFPSVKPNPKPDEKLLNKWFIIKSPKLNKCFENGAYGLYVSYCKTGEKQQEQLWKMEFDEREERVHLISKTDNMYLSRVNGTRGIRKKEKNFTRENRFVVVKEENGYTIRDDRGYWLTLSKYSFAASSGPKNDDSYSSYFALETVETE